MTESSHSLVLFQKMKDDDDDDGNSSDGGEDGDDDDDGGGQNVSISGSSKCVLCVCFC